MEWWRPDLVFPVLGALFAGSVVGLEREFRGQPAGLRTHLLVCLASAFLMLMSMEQGTWVRGLSEEIVRIDPVRMAHGVLTGVGFLCGGVIFRTGITVHGLTTAASLWITSALGMLFGVGLYTLAISATLMVVLVLSALRLFDSIIPQQAVANMTVRFSKDQAPTAAAFKEQLSGLGLKSSTFTQRLIEGGRMLEFTGNLRAARWDAMDQMLESLRADPRVLEFEVMPRKP
jgi:putative Mg2+ transporter-C (MgtC) family protein